jgi:hypothetical protein
MILTPFANRAGIKNEWCDGQVLIAQFYDGVRDSYVYRAEWIEPKKSGDVWHHKDAMFCNVNDHKALPKLIASLPAYARERVPTLEWVA